MGDDDRKACKDCFDGRDQRAALGDVLDRKIDGIGILKKKRAIGFMRERGRR
ncbi:hypothetical protein J2Z19_004472 [Ensifer adhaerens]|uniref:Uncharacterized protein n=1 Tax=Ensifer adhaerens TaxID=106592 RepID=A0ACC5T258_ENSAD|nr:hypothetical protein [Ensifer adhaerens]MBP1874739.1 hypothetical protein [Ensifer adhaerens]